MYLYASLACAAVFCAIKAVAAKRLLSSALWLAGTSVFVSIILYLVGMSELAVIELSVGAGLVTVLFVFAFTLAGEEAMSFRSAVPRLLSYAAALGFIFLFSRLARPTLEGGLVYEAPFPLVLWEQRRLDVFMHIVLIFSSVLGALGLLSENGAPKANGGSASQEQKPAEVRR